jgi:hypothetical protein
MAVIGNLPLTYYQTFCIVTSNRTDTPYADEEATMLIDPGMALKFHQYRLDEMRDAADKARLIAELPRKNRSFKLGPYRLTLEKEVTPHVPRMV